MSIEDTIKQKILSQYKSVRAFTQAIDIPYSTIDSMLKKGVRGTAVQTVIRVCDSLGLDLNAISYEILYGGIEKKCFSNRLEGPSDAAMEVAYSYEKADFGTKNAVRKLLDLSPQTETSREISFDDEIEAFRQELIAEQKGTTSSASGE